DRKTRRRFLPGLRQLDRGPLVGRLHGAACDEYRREEDESIHGDAGRGAAPACSPSALMSAVERFSVRCRSVNSLKNIGTKKIARNVAAIMPPITPVPAEWRAPAPAPLEKTSGITPRINASEVIRIGRKRSRAASTAAAEADNPSSRFSTANSTIRIAFFAARPSSVTRPIWKYTSFESGRAPTTGIRRLFTQIAASAPNVPNGSASSTESGSAHFSYCAARMKNTMMTASPSASPAVPAERFSWYEVPPQSWLKSAGSALLATFSTSWIASPEDTPGAALPKIFTAGRLLKRSSESGPEL